MSSGQSTKMSLVESVVSVITGYILTVLIQLWVYPLFGVDIPSQAAMLISLIVVLAAFAKNFTIRRVFNYLYIRGN